MYKSGPSDTELAAIGLRREDVEDTSVCEVWPENWEAFQIFGRCQTQWHTENGYHVGLNYEFVRWLMDLFKVKKKYRMDRLTEVQTMERAALRQMHKEASERNK